MPKHISTAPEKVGEVGFDLSGKTGHFKVCPSSVAISQRLAKRLVSYAGGRMRQHGLDKVVDAWSAKVGGLEFAGTQADDLIYHVAWTNDQGTVISVVGILLRAGIPIIDHGLEIDT
jgi:hypothetical protein